MVPNKTVNVTLEDGTKATDTNIVDKLNFSDRTVVRN